MNKTLILGSRGSGKTYRIIQKAINAHGIIVCATEVNKNHINNILRERGHDEIPVFTVAEVKIGKLRGCAAPLFIDEVQTVLLAAFAGNIEAHALGGYSFDTTDTDLFLLQNSF